MTRCACLVATKNETLLLVRVRDNLDWYLPGGKIEANETPEETLIRELAEELKISILKDSIKILYTVVGPAYGIPGEVELVCFSAQWTGVIIATGEISEVAWIDFQEHRQFAPAVKILADHHLLEKKTAADFSFLGIDHVQVAIPQDSEVVAREFYVHQLGMEEIPKPENLKKKGGLWLQIGRHQLHLGILHPFVPSTKAHPAFEIDCLGQYRKFLEKNHIVQVEEDLLEGAERFYVYDPFGNRLEFLEWKTRS